MCILQRHSFDSLEKWWTFDINPDICANTSPSCLLTVRWAITASWKVVNIECTTNNLHHKPSTYCQHVVDCVAPDQLCECTGWSGAALSAYGILPSRIRVITCNKCEILVQQES